MLKYPLLALIRLYRVVISPLLGPTCRFYPSCSQYAITAIGRHGAVRGSVLAARRLLRCHPWNPGGVDHVPPRRGADTDAQAEATGRGDSAGSAPGEDAVAGMDTDSTAPVADTDSTVASGDRA